MQRLQSLKVMGNHLNQMYIKTQIDLQDKNDWWIFGPLLCKKFVNQLYSLIILLHTSDTNNKHQKNKPITLDVSTIWSIIRSLHETHATFFHLFMPCQNIEENILRFRLWELDSIRSLLNFKRSHIQEDVKETIQWRANNEAIILHSINELKIFQNLPEKVKHKLVENALWKASLEAPMKRISYDTLIKNTNINDSHFQDLYDYSSMHVHPAYGGVRQQDKLTREENEIMAYTAIMQGCFVTAFFIIDFKSRYEGAKTVFERIETDHQKLIVSFEQKGRRENK